MVKIINESTNKKVTYANACYTGGGIYIFSGKFDDGTYFISGSEMEPYIINVKKKPTFNWDKVDCWTEDWVYKKDNFISEEKDRKTFNDTLKWIIKNKPSGNYATDEIEWILENPEDSY